MGRKRPTKTMSTRRGRPGSGRALGRALGTFSSINEVRVVAAFLALAKPGGDVSWDELRAAIAEAEGKAKPVSATVVASGLDRALANCTLVRTEVSPRRYRYALGTKLAEILVDESEAS